LIGVSTKRILPPFYILEVLGGGKDCHHGRRWLGVCLLGADQGQRETVEAPYLTDAE
jgi:hypothetical protein